MQTMLLDGVFLIVTGPTPMLLAETQAARPDRPWLTVVVALVSIILIALASCINPRRGHRD